MIFLNTVFDAWRLEMQCIVGWRVGVTLICKTVLALLWWSWKAERRVKVEISINAYSECARIHGSLISFVQCCGPAVLHLSVCTGGTDKHRTAAHPSLAARPRSGPDSPVTFRLLMRRSGFVSLLERRLTSLRCLDCVNKTQMSRTCHV